MSHAEIPLLRESSAFAGRLMAAARRFAEPAYFFHRRVNWSYRYAQDFYAQEAACFLETPDEYLAGTVTVPPKLADIYPQRLRPRQVAVVLTKVLVHRVFHALGSLMNGRIRARGTPIYRKGYVDDIELVFDPAEHGVVRAVFPFPISVRRQLRYLRFLRRTGHFFKLDGNPYLLADVLAFVARRDVRSLARLESRAQLRQALKVAALGVSTVQLSDEFDIGSLDFARRLARHPVRVVNSAHGVGKYFPVHAYQDFHVVTLKQQAYYHAIRDCRYALRRLNDTAAGTPAAAPAPQAPRARQTRLVFLSQTFGDVDDIIAQNENSTLDALGRAFGDSEAVQLYYKPHPNRRQAKTVAGFAPLARLDEVNGRDGTVFVSFFSTCQIDPAFKGRKILLRSRLIHPEIAFDDSETIVSTEELIRLIDPTALVAVPGGAAPTL